MLGQCWCKCQCKNGRPVCDATIHNTDLSPEEFQEILVRMYERRMLFFGDDRRPCEGENSNICVAEGCFGENCLKKGSLE